MYERNIYQFLAIYRFFAYGLAVVLTQVIPLEETGGPTNRIYVILTILGVYSILKVFSPIGWRHRGLMTYVILLGDLAVAIALVLYTGGLDSGFLHYGLIPLSTASFLFETRIAIAVAVLSAGSLVLAHAGLSQFTDNFVWVLDGNNLALLVMYAMSCLLVANLPYHTNLNIRNRIQQGAVHDERRRMKQEMHDGVAQTLTYLNLKIKLVSDAVSTDKSDQALTGLTEIKGLVQETYEDIRESIDQLSADGRGFPLAATLSDYSKDFSRANKIQVDFEAPPKLPGLSDMAQLQILRIVQEALTNVRKHAQATQAWVKLEQESVSHKPSSRGVGEAVS